MLVAEGKNSAIKVIAKCLNVMDPSNYAICVDLEVNKKYEVTNIVMSGFHTDVYLQGFEKTFQ